MTTAAQDPKRQFPAAAHPTPARVLTLDAARFLAAWRNLNGPEAPAVRPYLGCPDREAWATYHEALATRCDARWQPRTRELEVDFTRVQVASYTLIRRDGRVLAYTRSKGGDARLSLRRSIGVGGHVEPRDDAYAGNFGFLFAGGPVQEVAAACAWRELCEEIGGDARILPTVPRVRAYIYDPSDDVGRVHLGVVCVSDAPPGWEPITNGEILSHCWVTPEPVLAAPPGEWESWSVHLARALATPDGTGWRSL